MIDSQMKKSVLIIFSVILILSIFPLIFADLINIHK